MNRIVFPEKAAFSMQLDIRISDINYGMHMANDAVARFVNEARVGYLRKLGYEDELHIEGVSLIMRDSYTQFRSEGFYGNEIVIEVYTEVLSDREFLLFYKLLHKESEKALAYCRTSMLCFDYSIRKPVSIPEEFRKKLEG
ncbi:MAG: thioesterase family protein [Chitinophagales bacterium]|nr:thioesterase family protein [Chitinophagales bacterium]